MWKSQELDVADNHCERRIKGVIMSNSPKAISIHFAILKGRIYIRNVIPFPSYKDPPLAPERWT